MSKDKKRSTAFDVQRSLDYRGLQVIEINNVCGYPNLSTRLERAVPKGSHVVLGLQALLEMDAKLLAGPELKIVVDILPMLTVAGLPIVGYYELQGVWHKKPMMFRKNYGTMNVNIYSTFKRLGLDEHKQMLRSPRKLKWLKSLDKDSENYKLGRRMFCNFLPSSIYAPLKDGNDPNKR